MNHHAEWLREEYAPLTFGKSYACHELAAADEIDRLESALATMTAQRDEAVRIGDAAAQKLGKEQQLRERFEEEVDCAHMVLDDIGVPRSDDDGKFSLVGRIKGALPGVATRSAALYRRPGESAQTRHHPASDASPPRGVYGAYTTIHNATQPDRLPMSSAPRDGTVIMGHWPIVGVPIAYRWLGPPDQIGWWSLDPPVQCAEAPHSWSPIKMGGTDHA